MIGHEDALNSITLGSEASREGRLQKGALCCTIVDRARLLSCRMLVRMASDDAIHLRICRCAVRPLWMRTFPLACYEAACCHVRDVMDLRRSRLGGFLWEQPPFLIQGLWLSRHGLEWRSSCRRFACLGVGLLHHGPRLCDMARGCDEQGRWSFVPFEKARCVFSRQRKGPESL